MKPPPHQDTAAKPLAAPPPAGTRRDTRGTRARILPAARALFLAKGYEGTSMDQVAAAAPVSKRTLYQHFPSKAELFGAVTREVWSHLTSVPLLPEHTTEDPRAVLRAYVARLAEHWDQPDVIPLLRLVIAEAPRFPELSKAYFAAGKEPAVKGLAVYFSRLAAEGRLPPGRDPQLLAAQFLGAIKEPLFWPRVVGVPVAFDTTQAVERAVEAALRMD